MGNQTYALSLTERLLESGNHSLTDFWWEDYGLSAKSNSQWQLACDANGDAGNATAFNGHCMHCYADKIETKPARWSGYVHNSRRERRNKRGLLLGIYGGLGHHRYPGIGSGDVYVPEN